MSVESSRDAAEAGPIEVLIAYVSEKMQALDALDRDDALTSFRTGQRTAWVDLYWKLGEMIDRRDARRPTETPQTGEWWPEGTPGRHTS